MAGTLTGITEVEVSGCGQMQALIILARCQNSHGGAGGLTGVATIQLPLSSRSFSQDVGRSICARSLGLDRYTCTTKV
jgi:hypothetical protein